MAGQDGKGPIYGSDLIVDLMRACGIRYVALNPGATFRGLHESIVNYGGNHDPELILTTHEEIAVALAHGYAKATGRPMAAAVHNIVGLQHASMAIFNAWVERDPVLILGGTGPVDTSRRRPWIDWVHTALVQGSLVRDYVKWDDQPASLEAIPPSFLRGYRLAVQEPRGPVYICYDAALQEERLTKPIAVPDPATVLAVTPLAAPPAAVEQVAAWLVQAEYPVFLPGFLGRDPSMVPVLVELAEALGAAVIDVGMRHNFPSNHPADLTDVREQVLAEADLVVALEVHDLYGALRSRPDRISRHTRPLVRPGCRVVHVTLNDLHARGWLHDYNELQPADLTITADTAAVLPALLAEVRNRLGRTVTGHQAREERRRRIAARHHEVRRRHREAAERRARERPIAYPRLADAVWQVIREHDWQLAHGTLHGWARRLWDWERPDAFLGMSEGGGLGYGMGVSLGAALAHRGSDRLVVNLQPEGDFLFTPGALYTAAHHRIPLLTVLVDNQSYYNDEEHQEAIAIYRGRPPETKIIGIRLEDPPIDYRLMAESFGLYAEGPIEDPDQLEPALRRAVTVVVDRRLPALVHVRCGRT